MELSDQVASVAVRPHDGDMTVEPLARTRRSGDELFCAIQRAMDRSGLLRSDLSAVGLARGPGSFTGLRVAIATAKMLAMATGVEIISIPSALGVAVATDPPGPALIALSAKGDSAWVTLATRNKRWSIDGGSIMTPATFSAAIESGTVASVVGDKHLPPSFQEVCAAHGVTVIEPVYDAAAVLETCEARWQEGETDDPVTLLPLYPRLPEAVRLHNERASGR